MHVSFCLRAIRLIGETCRPLFLFYFSFLLFVIGLVSDMCYF